MSTLAPLARAERHRLLRMHFEGRIGHLAGEVRRAGGRG
jgi:hypothetical protein